jgi:hypothetical protein
MAATMALEPYFFWACLIASTVRRFPLFFLFFGYLQNLPVSDIGSADHAQDGKDGDEDASQPQPFVEVESDEEAEADATGHGKAELHDDGEVFSPGPIFFVVKKHYSPIGENNRLK